MKNIYVGNSAIHGRGIFTTDGLKKGDVVGVSHVSYDRVWYQVFPIGIFYNHSSEPNCVVNTDDNVNLVVANRDIEKNEELTVDYTKQLHLEQPRGDWI
tara:strand:+ start:626 stop:922 length:297 start_codon:yes stop_codon:yes gene_type:complete